MQENAADFVCHALFWPIWVLGTQSRNFHLARRPIKSLCKTQALLAGHRTQDFNLLRTRLFIRQHERTMCLESLQSKPPQHRGGP